MIKYDLYDNMLSQVHLLVAGATGSGKSVVINGIIYTAMLYKPSEKQFILIDPKRVELREYKDIPHTLYYACEPENMFNALQYAMGLCDRRFQGMQAQGIKKYNGPDVYIIIDEFADLILTDKRVKPLIQRLAQIGRASSIHIILATQTPIVRVLPTEIKCNFDSRVGLRTRSKQDSINILGRTGLETLPKYGQGVYMTPDEYTLYNIPYIDDSTRMELINHWKTCARHTKPKKHGILSRLFNL